MKEHLNGWKTFQSEKVPGDRERLQFRERAGGKGSYHEHETIHRLTQESGFCGLFFIVIINGSFLWSSNITFDDTSYGSPFLLFTGSASRGELKIKKRWHRQTESLSLCLLIKDKTWEKNHCFAVAHTYGGLIFCLHITVQSRIPSPKSLCLPHIYLCILIWQIVEAFVSN